MKATLKAHVTADGLTDIKEDMPLGTTYMVDLDSLRKMAWGHMDRPMQSVERETIWATRSSSGGNNGYLPVELLDIEHFNMDGATA